MTSPPVAFITEMKYLAPLWSAWANESMDSDALSTSVFISTVASPDSSPA